MNMNRRAPLTLALFPDGGEGEERAAKSETRYVVSYKAHGKPPRFANRELGP